MPFDGTNARGARAAYVIDRMLEMFDGGKQWLCGEWHRDRDDGTRERCLMSALHAVRLVESIKGDHAGKYMAKAIFQQTDRRQSIINFNDDSHTYNRVERMLLRARELALADVG